MPFTYQSVIDLARVPLNDAEQVRYPDSTLLLFEFVVPEDAEPFEASDIDVFMLALVGGRERTLKEYQQLLADAGWALVATIPTPSQTILEARPLRH